MLPTLKVKIGADTKELNAGLADAQGKLRRFGAAIAAATAAVAVGFAVALGAATKASFATIDAQAKLAQSLGTTVESVQVLTRAGDLAGVSIAGIEQATKDLTRRLAQAAGGTGPAVVALDRLGLSAASLMALPLDERIRSINDAIGRFVPVAERAAVAGQLFGEEGSIAMSRIDGATLDTAIDDVRRFGVAVSEVDADLIEEANDAMSRLGLAAQGLSNHLAVRLGPMLEAFANGLASLIDRSPSAQLGVESLSTAIDNTTLALGDEIDQTNRLMAVMQRGGMMSQVMAVAKLSEARSHLYNAEAIEAEARALIELELAAVQSEIRANQEALAAVQTGTIAYEEREQVLVELLTRMNALRHALDDPTSALDATRAEIAEMEQAIKNAVDGMVSFDGEIITSIELSGRLSAIAGSIDFAGAESSAVALAQELGVSLDIARRLAGLGVGEAIAADGDGRGSQRGSRRAAAMANTDRILAQQEPLRQAFIAAQNAANGFGAAVVAAGSDGADAMEDLEITLTPIQERMQSIAQTIEQAMGAGFMAMIDGSKSAADAFRDMAKSIIAKLYDILVVQQLVGSWDAEAGTGTGLTGLLMGGIGELFSFDGGGFTGSGSRSGGVDGRGGFPAILHPNETVTDHTKGQSAGGSVTVNQTFNVSVGVKEAIRAEMAVVSRQMMEATKATIHDTVRRGGSFGAAF